MRRLLVSLVFWLVGSWGGSIAAAEAFPSRPIRMIVPVPPGGTGDLVSRPLAGAAGKALNRTMARHMWLEHNKGAGLIRARKITAA